MGSPTLSPDDDRLTQALVRVAELESALDKAERSAQASQQDLQHFVYAASHDLQEPLRAITTYTQLLERLYAHDEQAREFAQFITQGVVRMNTLIHNLLTYSRVNPAPMMGRVNTGATLQMTLFKLAAKIKECDAVVRVSELPEVVAHEGQMGQLFEAVLTNSLLFRSERRPEISVSAEEGEVEKEGADVLVIQDNGMGIEPQFLTHVLQPFKRLHGKEYPGNGLGLAICDKIMRAHKGRIWLESDGVSGTTVRLAFPL